MCTYDAPEREDRRGAGLRCHRPSKHPNYDRARVLGDLGPIEHLHRLMTTLHSVVALLLLPVAAGFHPIGMRSRSMRSRYGRAAMDVGGNETAAASGIAAYAHPQNSSVGAARARVEEPQP